MKMNFHKQLPTPQEVKKEYPLSERMIEVKSKRDEEIRAVFDGTSNKFILIIGPCLGWEKTEQLIYDIADKL